MRPTPRHAALLLLALAGACAGSARGETPTGSTPPGGPPAAGPDYVPGQSYFGRDGHVEYIAGDAPIIYTAPHGGALRPAAIPDRTAERCGGTAVTVTDVETADLARRLQRAHHARFGRYPHVIINHLSRRKLDANRPLEEAACGDAAATAAWHEWHGFVAAARAAVLRGSGAGWYVDLHGHGHAEQRLELGYLLDGARLRLDDATLDATAAHEERSSVRALSGRAPASFSALLRGPRSLGALYARAGIPAVPSDVDPAPDDGEPYFDGGYNTARHACGAAAPTLGGAADGAICGVQIEANYTGVRDTPENRQRFAEVTAAVLGEYLAEHAGIALGAAASPARQP